MWSKALTFLFVVLNGLCLVTAGAQPFDADIRQTADYKQGATWVPVLLKDNAASYRSILGAGATSSPVPVAWSNNIVSFTASGEFRFDLVLASVPPPSIQLGTNLTTESGEWIQSLLYTEGGVPDGDWRITSWAFPTLVGIVANFSPRNMLALTNLSLPSLQFIGGSFNVATVPLLTNMNLPALRTIVGDFQPSMNTQVNLPALVSVGGGVFASGSLTNMSLPALKVVSGQFNPNLPGMNSLSLPALEYVGNTFNPAITNATNISLPELRQVGSNFSPSSLPLVASMNLNLLEAVGGSFTPQSMPAVTNLSLPSLKVVGAFQPSLAGITNLSMPSLQRVNSTWSVTATNLAHVTLPTNGTLLNISSSVTMSGMKLTASSVENILVALSLLNGSNGTTAWSAGRNVNLSGGTSSGASQLTATASNARAVITNRGATVTLNP